MKKLNWQRLPDVELTLCWTAGAAGVYTPDAVANAIRSGEVPVRARALGQFNREFIRIENLLRPEERASFSMGYIRANGELFVDIECDQDAVERWVIENAVS